MIGLSWIETTQVSHLGYKKGYTGLGKIISSLILLACGRHMVWILSLVEQHPSRRLAV